MPNMLVLRPADAVEAAECWEIAMNHRTGPCALMFSRQPLDAVRTDGSSENRSSRGAYVLAEAEGGKRVATILATGSEVSIALKARETLQAGASRRPWCRCRAGSCSNSRMRFIAVT